MEIIFSLDPGFTKIGWAVTQEDGKVLGYGLLFGSVDKKIPFNRRMNYSIIKLWREFSALFDKYSVTKVVWEIVPSFGQMSSRELVQSTIITLKVLTFSKNLPYQEYSPRSWHKKLLGKPGPTKEEVKVFLVELMDSKVAEDQLPVDAPYDVYDAIAIGQVASKEQEWNTYDA